jgi:hypothetical protein
VPRGACRRRRRRCPDRLRYLLGDHAHRLTGRALPAGLPWLARHRGAGVHRVLSRRWSFAQDQAASRRHRYRAPGPIPVTWWASSPVTGACAAYAGVDAGHVIGRQRDRSPGLCASPRRACRRRRRCWSAVTSARYPPDNGSGQRRDLTSRQVGHRLAGSHRSPGVSIPVPRTDADYRDRRQRGRSPGPTQRIGCLCRTVSRSGASPTRHAVVVAVDALIGCYIF